MTSAFRVLLAFAGLLVPLLSGCLDQVGRATPNGLPVGGVSEIYLNRSFPEPGGVFLSRITFHPAPEGRNLSVTLWAGSDTSSVRSGPARFNYLFVFWENGTKDETGRPLRTPILFDGEWATERHAGGFYVRRDGEYLLGPIQVEADPPVGSGAARSISISGPYPEFDRPTDLVVAFAYVQDAALSEQPPLVRMGAVLNETVPLLVPHESTFDPAAAGVRSWVRGDFDGEEVDFGSDLRDVYYSDGISTSVTTAGETFFLWDGTHSSGNMEVSWSNDHGFSDTVTATNTAARWIAIHLDEAPGTWDVTVRALGSEPFVNVFYATVPVPETRAELR